jgi:hypothetical protein
VVYCVVLIATFFTRYIWIFCPKLIVGYLIVSPLSEIHCVNIHLLVHLHAL